MLTLQTVRITTVHVWRNHLKFQFVFVISSQYWSWFSPHFYPWLWSLVLYTFYILLSYVCLTMRCLCAFCLFWCTYFFVSHWKSKISSIYFSKTCWLWCTESWGFHWHSKVSAFASLTVVSLHPLMREGEVSDSGVSWVIFDSYLP